MNIKAAVTLKRSDKFKIMDIVLSDPMDDEVIVKIVGSGICHTDLAAVHQHFPTTLPAVFGHEGAGIVELVGKKVTKVKPGDHVVLSWNYCSECRPCKDGEYYYCENFITQNLIGCRSDGSLTLKNGEEDIHGSFFRQSSFADYALANEQNVVKVRDDIPLEILAPLGCGIQTGAGAVLNEFKPNDSDSIVIFGTGSVGLSAVLASVLCKCKKIIAIDIDNKRLDIAKKMGATHIINSKEKNAVEEIMKICEKGVNYSLECVGNPEVLKQAVDVLAVRGVAGQIGVVAPGTNVSLDMYKIMNGRTVMGIVEGNSISDTFIPKLIELYAEGKFPFDQLIKFYKFEDINKAVEDMENGDVVKPVLKF
ncbi:MAG: NAD(P)-dependent alcohol dehydrogenase [Clostridiales bacterium]